jgi:DnaJ homolog subfamily C member 3
MRIFRLSYFFLPASSPSPSQSPALNTLKQCLHFDPDSKPCLSARRLIKKFDRSFAELDDLVVKEDWRGVINLLVGIGKDKDKAFAQKFDEAMASHTSREQLLGTEHSPIPLPDPALVSPRRQDIVRAICRAYIQLGDARNSGKWCETLLGMQGTENDEYGLTGKGEGLLLKEEWEEAVRIFEKAFDASGRSNRDVSSVASIVCHLNLIHV